MSNFQGWFLKFGDNIMPSRYILEDGWEATPNQRLEVDAWRDANADLHRDTAAHTKSKIVAKIRPLTGTERAYLDNIIGLATLSSSDRLQRRVLITYWNDEELNYVTCYAYISDITYTIKRVNADRTDVVYKEFELHLIEY